MRSKTPYAPSFREAGIDPAGLEDREDVFGFSSEPLKTGREVVPRRGFAVRIRSHSLQVLWNR